MKFRDLLPGDLLRFRYPSFDYSTTHLVISVDQKNAVNLEVVVEPGFEDLRVLIFDPQMKLESLHIEAYRRGERLI